MSEKPMIREASELMIQAMKDLRERKIETKEATALAQLGMTIVQAANAEVQFVKAAKGVLRGGIFGDDVRMLEPPDEETW